MKTGISYSQRHSGAIDSGHCGVDFAVIGHGEISIQGARAEFMRRTLIPPSVRVIRGHFSLLDPVAETIGRLNAFDPDVIATYGSYLEALFGHVLESGAPFVSPKVVVHSADGLSERARRLIVEHFGIGVLSVYRAIEAPYIGFECERHTV